MKLLFFLEGVFLVDLLEYFTGGLFELRVGSIDWLRLFPVGFGFVGQKHALDVNVGQTQLLLASPYWIPIYLWAKRLFLLGGDRNPKAGNPRIYFSTLSTLTISKLGFACFSINRFPFTSPSHDLIDLLSLTLIYLVLFDMG